MRISLALFADYAIAHQMDGKLYVTGGGIRTLPFPVFPATQSRLALALGIEVPAPELGKPHTMTIEASGPTSDPIIVKPVAVTFTVLPRGGDPAESGYVHFVSNMENVSFPVQGRYSFNIVVDGQTIAELALEAVQVSGEGVSPAAESTVRLRDGYAAFARGEIGSAEEIFRDVVARFPTEPGGHNNLGFVLLAKGDADAALASFVKARELGYAQPEINEPNVACALYLKGDPATALEVFQECLRSRIFRSSATLFGIGPSGLFPVQLNSAADYVALMTLNAGWSAMRSGDSAERDHYLRAAHVAELVRREDFGGQHFAQSVDALKAQSSGG